MHTYTQTFIPAGNEFLANCQAPSDQPQKRHSLKQNERIKQKKYKKPKWQHKIKSTTIKVVTIHSYGSDNNNWKCNIFNFLCYVMSEL